jgi:hypothetical protein
MTEQKKQRPFKVDRDARQQRRRAVRAVEHTHMMRHADGRELENRREFETNAEHAEARQLVEELARTYIGRIEFYKSEWGGSKPHAEAVKDATSMRDWQRAQAAEFPADKVDWHHIAAVGEQSMPDALALWTRVREAADDELETGRRAAKVAGNHTGAYALAQFLAIRDAFADHWQPQGGIESAMIDMLTVAFSLQMYWTAIAHERAIHDHDEQKKDIHRFESKGWKSPYQYAADAVEQAYRLADGYNRQFLRVLRQMRDLRRYSPVVIQNNGGQVNLANQQVNVSAPEG